VTIPTEIDYLEFPIAHLCSLHCDGCSAYSNYGLSQKVSLEQAELWLKDWSGRINPNRFRILGGEPFLNEFLPEIVELSRTTFPDARIQVCTNGLNFDNHIGIEKTLIKNSTSLHLSVHARDDKYLDSINNSIETMLRWEKDYGLKITFGDNVKNWNRFYKGVGREMRPFDDGNPNQSYQVCHSWYCVNLVENKLWKCPQIANLHLVADKFKLNEVSEWKRYLGYKGLSVGCSDEELNKFVNRKAEAICSMCPSSLDNYEKDVRNVNFKLNNVEFFENHFSLNVERFDSNVKPLFNRKPDFLSKIARSIKRTIYKQYFK